MGSASRLAVAASLSTLLLDFTTYLGGVAPYHYFDFVNNRALYASNDVGGVSSAPGYSFSRASAGYYTNLDGTLTSFASGALRRGDLGVLIEGARTNLLLQSQTFDNAGWAKVNSTVTANSAAAPDGTTTANTLTEGAVTDEHYAAQAVTKAATATTYTASVYAKSSTRNILIVCRQASVSANNATMGVNLTTGAVGLAAASAGTFAAASGVVTALANGWFRIAMTFTTSTETALSVRHYITDGTYNGGFAGNGTSGISIWGAQLEAASYPSSYIPTTTASATRAADNLVYTLPGIASGYSMWAQYADSPNGTSRVIDFGNTTLIRRSGGTHLNFNGAGLEGSAVGAFVSGKAAVAVDAAAVRAALNGASVSVTAGSYSAASQTAWNLGSTGTGSYLDGYISRVAYFNTALSGANLQTVTT